MKRYTTVLAMALASLAGAASAQAVGLAGDISVEAKPFVSTRSRAEVRADLDAFRKAGVNPWADEFNQLAGFVSGRSRSQVAAEFAANRHTVAALYGEDSGSSYLAGRRSALQAMLSLAGKPGERSSQ